MSRDPAVTGPDDLGSRPGHGWSHDALHGLARVMVAVRRGRAKGAISEPEETRVAAMLYDLEQMVIARGQR